MLFPTNIVVFSFFVFEVIVKHSDVDRQVFGNKMDYWLFNGKFCDKLDEFFAEVFSSMALRFFQFAERGILFSL